MNSMPVSGFELPERYHQDRLQLLVQGPHTLFTYWEVSNRKRWLCSQHFACDYGALPKTLRIYDVTAVYFNGNNANGFRELGTTPEASSWYIHGVQAGTTYMADFGISTPEGQFVPLLRSNAVMTPRDSAAGWGAPLVSTVPEVREPGVIHVPIRPHDFENFNAYSNCMK
ncbi:hypothetical protein PM3016_661 [Paenibacillus mucilaginosus 3016]|uniref:DUF4912 domain-containing protein n=4 Tax=Paenibacillus mucilaginosus TaxID=61624 RepID=H6NTM9_9BACL|nr:hypothetical protein KNP414_00758 [Paenibacillus mucilaginosus KNP414]AFC27623.1 hypothetical protein PM3016_661 [Paenibacillus mucilaginosus 3016]AFH59778.2 hypothetical protein B2K_03390 [Paenibacillus mucilaginosus K02]WDM28339.1 DUF4912 domain-containing protein [Paenibacillus mucilaginosus]WFA16511.1 DUF4912 domain-containing protein [Paenibacillus mucilaginosus]